MGLPRRVRLGDRTSSVGRRMLCLVTVLLRFFLDELSVCLSVCPPPPPPPTCRLSRTGLR